MSIRINLLLCILTAIYSLVSIRRPSCSRLYRAITTVTCKIQVLYPGAPSHQVQDAPIGDVPAAL